MLRLHVDRRRLVTVLWHLNLSADKQTDRQTTDTRLLLSSLFKVLSVKCSVLQNNIDILDIALNQCNNEHS